MLFRKFAQRFQNDSLVTNLFTKNSIMITIQKEVSESAQLTDAQKRVINEESQLTQMLHHLAPWLEKTDGIEQFGDWETTLATRMMIKLLELWLTEESRQRVEKMLEFYHPLDRAAMAYALVVYVMTGTTMTFKSAIAQHHYMIICQMLMDNMPELMFAEHLEKMLNDVNMNNH